MSVRTTGNSVLKNSSPATFCSMLKMRVQVCEVRASLMNASMRPHVNCIVKRTLPPTDPMTVSSSTVWTPKFRVDSEGLTPMVG